MWSLDERIQGELPSQALSTNGGLLPGGGTSFMPEYGLIESLTRSQTSGRVNRPMPSGHRELLEPSTDSDVRLSQLAQHAQMLGLYGSHGGILNADQYASLVFDHVPQVLSQLARSVLNRSVVSIRSRSSLELPLFQFKPNSVECKDVVAEVLGLLRARYSDWEVALWFVAPNRALGGRLPVELARAEDVGVCDAARAEFSWAY